MKHVRLVSRGDAPLAITLIATAIVVFQGPMTALVAFAEDVERDYHLHLLPGLVVLVLSFGFHQYRKRQEVKVSAAAAAIEARAAHARADELEQLVALGRALGQAVDPSALKQVLWRHLPAFSHDRPVWIMAREEQRWGAYLQDTRSMRLTEDLERMAAQSLPGEDRHDVSATGAVVNDHICFPLIAGDVTIGVFGILNTPPLDPSLRRALGAAINLVAIAMRNTQLLLETRDKSLRDGLTGCFNRAHGFESLDVELRRAKRTRSPLSVIMFDIDHFKDINDQHGHLAGDMILSAIGQLIMRVLRVTDLKCRYGGDEFLLVLPETALSGAVQVAESLLHEISHLAIAFADREIAVTASVGIAATVTGETDAKAVITRTDDALYQAKRSGRNGYAVAGDVRSRSADVLRLA
jgi:diguanylate cyclase (GGDEF)-like protein